MLLMPIDVHQLFDHLGGSGLAKEFQVMAERIAENQGLKNDTVFIDKVYTQIETWYKNTYL